MLALLVAIAALGLLEINFDPLPVDIDAGEAAVDMNRFTAVAAAPRFAELAEPIQDVQQHAAAPTADVDFGEANSDRARLQRNVRMLESAIAYLEKVSDYTTTFYKRELVNGSMVDGQVIQLKLRHRPFSVYMKWIVGDAGRELLYVDGQNDGNMLVKAGGIKGRLLPCIKLNPSGSMALSKSRHPVTKAGLLNLTRRLLNNRREELAAAQLPVCCRWIPNQTVDGCNCGCLIIDYSTPEVRPPYRRSVQYFETQHWLPICVMNYSWEAGADEPGESALIEHYSYSDIRVNQRLADADFDRANAKYSLRR